MPHKGLSSRSLTNQATRQRMGRVSSHAHFLIAKWRDSLGPMTH
jgi:hypothetical protein